MGFSSCSEQGLLFVVAGFSSWWLLSWSMGSRGTGSSGRSTRLSGCASQTVAHRLRACSPWAREWGLSSAGVWVWLLHGTCIFWTRYRTVSPALAGRFLSTVTPGKSTCSYNWICLIDCQVLVPAYSLNVTETSECVLIFGGDSSISWVYFSKLSVMVSFLTIVPWF